MDKQLTLHEVLESAIQKEIVSRNLYVNLRRNMKNQAAKEAFQILAEQEEIHQHILEDYLQGKLKERTLSPGFVVDYKIADCLDQPEISANMEIKDIFLVAAKKEISSHLLYTEMAAIHPPGAVKRLLEGLASQELDHKNRIETLYTEVAFPQTDGG
jgi:rubrerythrin